MELTDLARLAGQQDLELSWALFPVILIGAIYHHTSFFSRGTFLTNWSICRALLVVFSKGGDKVIQRPTSVFLPTDSITTEMLRSSLWVCFLTQFWQYQKYHWTLTICLLLTALRSFYWLIYRTLVTKQWNAFHTEENHHLAPSPSRTARKWESWHFPKPKAGWALGNVK